MKILGKNPIGLSFEIHDPKKYDLYKGELKRISDDISQLTQGIITKGMAKAIGKLLGFGAIFSIDMTERGELLGNVTIIVRKGAEIKNKKIIEAFIGQISVALQRKLAQDALKESETKYRNVVEYAHDGIYIIHPEKGFQYTNPAFEDITGYSRREIHAEDFNFRRIIHPDDLSMIEKRMESRKQGQQVSDRYEFRIVTKEGMTRIIEATTVNVGYPDDIMVLGILRDITEREQAFQAIEEALALEKQFKADAAHFFLNPIAICRGHMDLAIERANEEIKDRLTLSIHALKRIESVIRNIVEKGQIRE
jgi:PAS domain S-box-containing protein